MFNGRQIEIIINQQKELPKSLQMKYENGILTYNHNNTIDFEGLTKSQFERLL